MWSTFTGNMKYTIATIMDANSGPLKDMIVMLIDLSKWVMTNQETIVRWVTIIINAVKWFVIWKTTVFAVVSVMKLWNAAIIANRFAVGLLSKGWNVATASVVGFNRASQMAFKTNVILAVAAAIYVIVRAIIDLNKKVKEQTEQQKLYNEQIQKTRDLADGVKQVALEWENLGLMTKEQQETYFGQVQGLKAIAEQTMTNVKIAKKGQQDEATAFIDNMARYKELNAIRDKTPSQMTEWIRLQKSLNPILNQNVTTTTKLLNLKPKVPMGNPESRPKEQAGATQQEAQKYLDDLNAKLEKMKKMGLGKMTGSANFDLKPSASVNDLTTELSTKRNIKNITLNIQNLTGVETLTTNNMTESREQIGKLILEELNKATYQYVAQNN
jgi:hypothetical protein